MKATKNLAGEKIGKWTVLEMVFPKVKKTKWRCICECGEIKEVYACHLISGKSSSCIRCATDYHGLKNTPEWQSWKSMKIRCNDKNHKAYHRYGGRGIKICDRWENSFVNFLKDMGKRPEGYTLDRIDNNKGYFKENCRWSSKSDQQNNTVSNRYFEYEGETYSLAQLSRKINVNYRTLYSRIARNVNGCASIYVEIKKM